MNAPGCLAALAAVAAAGLLTACSSTEAVATTNKNTQPEARRSYSQKRLKSTGESNLGEGLAKVDPSFQILAER